MAVAGLYVAWLFPLLKAPPGTWLTGHSPLYDYYRSAGALFAWQCGIYDSRWLPTFDGGYGYPILGLYAPLLAWTGAASMAMWGIGATAMNVCVAVWLLVGCVGVWLLSGSIWSRIRPGESDVAFWAGIVSVVAWLISPYLRANLYTRADGSEFTAMSLLPWVAWAGLRLLASERPPRSLLPRATVLAMAVALTILAHNVYAVFAMGLLLALPGVGWWLDGRRPRGPALAAYCSSVSAGLLLAAFFWVPAVVEMHYTRVYQMFSTTPIEASLVPLHDLVDVDPLVWGNAFPPPINLGVVSVFGAVSWCVAMGMSYRPGKARSRRTLCVLGAIALFAMSLSMPISEPFWCHFPIVRVVQFAWRTMSITTITLCLLWPAWLIAAMQLTGAKQRLALLLYASLCILCVHRSALSLTSPAVAPLPKLGEMWQGRVTTAAAEEYTSIWREGKVPSVPPGSIAAGSGIETHVAPSTPGETDVAVRNRNDRTGTIVVGRSYFPGWRVSVFPAAPDVHIAPSPDGLLEIRGIPPGECELRLTFGNTILRLMCKMVSAMTALALALLWVRKLRAKRSHPAVEHAGSRSFESASRGVDRP